MIILYIVAFIWTFYFGLLIDNQSDSDNESINDEPCPKLTEEDEYEVI